jgi:hypothetical protein
MTTISYSDFTNSGKLWTSYDDEQLIKLYNEDKIDILQIAMKFLRPPGGIISRLIKFNIIEDKNSARGYEDYITSNLYIEACELTKNRFLKKDKPNIEISKDDIIKSFNKVNKNMLTLQKQLNKYNHLKDQNEKLTEENNNLKNIMVTLQTQLDKYNQLKDENEKLIEEYEYATIVIKDKEYFLINNEVYKIKKNKGELYGIYDSDKNKVIKIRNI